MKFFLDENFPKSSIDLLVKSGNEIIDIRGTEHEGLDDASIFDLAQKNSAIFLTTDKDFFHTIPFLFEKHFGVIVIALSKPNRNSINEKLIWFIENYDLSNFNSKVALLQDNSYTIR
ncbi:MAG: DUF5615 family PIN-like protein [Ignavibacteria bacterium]|jgi:predicted nuclease of predicted toxin-antitoxin system